MNSVNNIEVFLVVVIVVLQLYVFLKTLFKIIVFKHSIPNVMELLLKKYYFKDYILGSVSPTELLRDIERYQYKKIKSSLFNNLNLPNDEIIEENVFYAVGPNDDGDFEMDSISTNFVISCKFKFVTTAPHKANFSIVYNPNNFNNFQHVNFACDYLNAKPAQIENIVTDEMGEVELIGDKWILIQKAKIRFVENSSNSSDDDSAIEEVSLITFSGKKNFVFEKINHSINNYLLRNRGASIDFNLIKDIVERNTSAIEEDINLSIAIPLYLGLMGTMIGIVLGLFNMPDMSAANAGNEMNSLFNEGINLLIGGVKIAMIASFIGLLLTIINSGWLFKNAHTKLEAKKNDLYTFIQIELLPVINDGLASTLDSLQRNLLRFKDDFTDQLKLLSATVGKMEGVFDQGNIALSKQKDIIDSIDRAKVSEMTKYNVKVLQQLDISVSQFEKFNNHISNVNQFVINSNQIVSRTNELLDRTGNFEQIANNLESKLDQSSKLLDFLSAHFEKLEQHKSLTSSAVVDVGHSIEDAFRELKIHIQNSSQSIKDFATDEANSLRGAMAESKTNLGNLSYLSNLKDDVSQFKMSSASQGERLKQAIEKINENMAKSIALLEEIEKNNLTHKLSSFLSKINNVFKSKKKKI